MSPHWQDSGTLSAISQQKVPGFTLGFKLPQRPHLDRQNISQRIYQRIWEATGEVGCSWDFTF